MFKRTSFAKGSLLQDHMIINECKYDLLTKYLACLTMLINLRWIQIQKKLESYHKISKWTITWRELIQTSTTNISLTTIRTCKETLAIECNTYTIHVMTFLDKLGNTCRCNHIINPASLIKQTVIIKSKPYYDKLTIYRNIKPVDSPIDMNNMHG